MIALEAIEFVERLSRRDQLSIRHRLVQIRDFPANHVDFSEHDDVGRVVDINICGRFAIKYWTDHAGLQIKVLDVHDADRRP
jgi:hypothetical protein